MEGLFSELLKYKRTFMGKLIVFFPLFFAVYALVLSILMQNPLAEAHGNTAISYGTFLASVFNWWSFLFLPLGYALFAALAASQEKKAGNYQALLSRNVSPAVLWVSKILGMAVYTLLSSCVLILVVSMTGLIGAEGVLPAGKILAGSLVCWLVSLPLIPLQLWAATRGGIFLSMGMGFAGMILGVVAAPGTIWIICPWSWATRLMCPVIGVHPNGTMLSDSDPLLSCTAIPLGIVVSLAALAVFTLFTTVWFTKRER